MFKRATMSQKKLKPIANIQEHNCIQQLSYTMKTCLDYIAEICRFCNISNKLLDDLNKPTFNLSFIEQTTFFEKMLKRISSSLPKQIVLLQVHNKMTKDYQQIRQDYSKLVKENKSLKSQVNNWQKKLKQQQQKMKQLAEKLQKSHNPTKQVDLPAIYFQKKVEKLLSEEKNKKITSRYYRQNISRKKSLPETAQSITIPVIVSRKLPNPIKVSDQIQRTQKFIENIGRRKEIATL